MFPPKYQTIDISTVDVFPIGNTILLILHIPGKTSVTLQCGVDQQHLWISLFSKNDSTLKNLLDVHVAQTPLVVDRLMVPWYIDTQSEVKRLKMKLEKQV